MAGITPKEQRSVAMQDGVVRLIDQRLVPHELKFVTVCTMLDMCEAITNMTVRGAPAIGAAAAYAFGMHSQQLVSKSQDIDSNAFLAEMKEAHAKLLASRPTAVNLQWAIDRMLRVTQAFISDNAPGEFVPKALADKLSEEADAIAEEDVSVNAAIANNGAALLPEGKKSQVIHHCNTGALATVDWGTALGVIRKAHMQGKIANVWVDETRPRLQGARLTAWELKNWGVPFKLMPDGASGLVMQRGQADAIFVGADRVAANGDTANKVGTYNLAAVAHDNGVPFYVCAPLSTIDLSTASGNDITIEERGAEEVVSIDGHQFAPDDCPVFNPAFDVTPSRLIMGIVTEHGVASAPFEQSLKELFAKAGQ